jgi:hypothetical protein
MPQSPLDLDCGCYFCGGHGYLVEVSLMEIFERIRKDDDFAAMENERCWVDLCEVLAQMQ